jgi:hypothetical protein
VFLILIIPLAVKFPKYASIAFGLSLVWVLIDSKGGFDKFKSQDHRKPTAIALELNKPQEIVCRANEWTDDFLVGKKLEWDLPDDVIYSVMVNGETSLEGLSGPKMEIFPQLHAKGVKRINTIRFKTESNVILKIPKETVRLNKRLG